MRPEFVVHFLPVMKDRSLWLYQNDGSSRDAIAVWWNVSVCMAYSGILEFPISFHGPIPWYQCTVQQGVLMKKRTKSINVCKFLNLYKIIIKCNTNNRSFLGLLMPHPKFNLKHQVLYCTNPGHTVSVLGRDKGYTAKYGPQELPWVQAILHRISRVES